MVRFSLALARPIKPVFSWVRARRAFPKAETDSTQGTEPDLPRDQAEVPYVHIRPVTGHDDSWTQGPHRFSESTPSAGRSPAVDSELIRIGLFVPARRGSLPAATHVRVLRRFYHPSVEQTLQTCSPRCGALHGGRLTNESGCRPDSENRCPPRVDGGFPPETGRLNAFRSSWISTTTSSACLPVIPTSMPSANGKSR